MSANAIAIMLGRRGSVGFPGKNLYPVLGRPLMEYALLAATNSRRIDQVFISTDDPDIAGIGRRHKALIIDRPPELSSNTALFEDALVHAYREGLRRARKTPAYVAILMCNAPGITAELLDLGFDMLDKDVQADSAVTVSIYNMWSPLRARRLNSRGYLDPFVPFETFGDPRTLSCDRDSQGDVYYADMGVTISRLRALDNIREGLLPQKWMGQKILPIRNWAGLDLDYEWQIPIVEFWLKKHGFTEHRTPYDSA